MSWSTNTLIICRSIAKARYLNATGSTLTVQHWRIGSVNLWLCRLGRPSSQTIPREDACSRHRRPRRPVCGLTVEMNGLGGATPHPLVGISSHQIAKGSTPKIISRSIKAGCTPMVTPGSKTSTAPATSTRLPAWRMPGVSSSTSTRPKARPWPMKPSIAWQAIAKQSAVRGAYCVALRG